MGNAMLQVKDLAAFRETVVESDEPTVVMFWATWCPFCRRFKQEFERLAAAHPWRFAAVYLDDEDNPLWDDYAVDVVPTLALFQDGKVVDRLNGVLGYGISRKMVDEFVRRLQPVLA
ncbi:MAG: thioredoxin family protein [Methanobacteriota archaeon]|nr:MAG: thioredoxin family protein [Euryarchaeota archaeon]TLZ83261.1 MAG: thioredoxin family protein [Euryarchaeota archaeon]